MILKHAAKRFLKNRMAVICLAIGLIIMLACFFAPLVTKWDPAGLDLQNTMQRPDSIHLLGTDSLGRDMFARVLYGGRTTFKITIGAVAVSLLGAVFGVFSGYAGGNIDIVISRLSDTLTAVPVYLMAILCEIVFGWGKGYFLFALGIAMIPPLTRLSRNLTIDVKTSEFIEAARALGVSEFRIITGHIIPNIAPQLIVHIGASFADAMINCTILGYLGIGVQPSVPEWGSLVEQSYTYILSRPYLAAGSAASVAVTILCFAIAANGLRDAVAVNSKED